MLTYILKNLLVAYKLSALSSLHSAHVLGQAGRPFIVSFADCLDCLEDATGRFHLYDKKNLTHEANEIKLKNWINKIFSFISNPIMNSEAKAWAGRISIAYLFNRQ